MTIARAVGRRRPAVFLDRDGVLNRVVWRDGKPASPRRLEELEIEPTASGALAALKACGYALFAVTNQPDVARGRMPAEALEAIHAAMGAALPVEEIAACLHDDADACACRKPNPGLLLDLAERHDLDLARSWMVGDQDRDIACGRQAGCSTVLIAQSYNSGTGKSASGDSASGADHVVDSLWQAACKIMLGSAASARARAG